MDRSELMDLYKTQSDAFGRYIGIIWQFPLALITANVAVASLNPDRLLLLVMVVANFVLICFVFTRHVANQGALRDQLKWLEGQLFNEETGIPPIKWKAAKPAATSAVIGLMLSLNVLLLLYLGYDFWISSLLDGSY